MMMTVSTDSEKRMLDAVAGRVVTHLATENKSPEPINVEHRQWGASKPVLHLALALRHEVMTMRDEIYDDIAIEKMLDEPERLDGAITNAEIFHNFICGSPLFRINDADTITVVAG